MTIIPIVIGSFGTVIKRSLKGLEILEAGGPVETIQTTALSLHVKNSQGVSNNNNNNNNNNILIIIIIIIISCCCCYRTSSSSL